MSDTTRDLVDAGRRLGQARRIEERAMKRAREVALKALERGETEVGVARMLGVDRMLVRKWAGKR